MNNYESPNVAEIGSATNVIRGSKWWFMDLIDTLFIIDTLEWYDDIDETD